MQDYDNPFDYETVCSNIEASILDRFDMRRGVEYEIMQVPNIVNITYGRDVGYKIEQEIFDRKISGISATNIRKEMRDKSQKNSFTSDDQ